MVKGEGTGGGKMKNKMCRYKGNRFLAHIVLPVKELNMYTVLKS